MLQGDECAATHQHPSWFGEVERHDGDLFDVDVLPDVQFGPVQQRMDSDVILIRLFGPVLVPQLRRLIFVVPFEILIARREVTTNPIPGVRP